MNYTESLAIVSKYKSRYFGTIKFTTSAVNSHNTRVYPKVSGLAAWSEKCKWYSSLPLGAVVSLFLDSVQ
jgi:hypothetical protein